MNTVKKYLWQKKIMKIRYLWYVLWGAHRIFKIA